MPDKTTLHYFHAEAHALAGKLTLPFAQDIKKQADVSLEGQLPDLSAAVRAQRSYFSEHAKNYRLEGIISFASAHTQVAGHASNKHKGAAVTLATSVVEGLNVLNVVTADRVVAQICTTHIPGQPSPYVTFLGTHFENLRIAGHRAETYLKLDLPGERAEGETALPVDQGTDLMRAVEEQYQTLKASIGALGHQRQTEMRLGDTDRLLATKYHGFNLDYADIRDLATTASKKDIKWDGITCSLVEHVEVKDISVKAPDGQSVHIPSSARSFGHIIHIPDFGNVSLAELTVNHNSYQLTMIRLEMDGIADGSVSISTCEVNGWGTGGGNGGGGDFAGYIRRDTGMDAPALRLLQGDLFRTDDGKDVPETRGFVIGGHYKLDVFIAPPGQGSIQANDPFPDGKLDWKGKDFYLLQVIFAEPNQWAEPFIGKILLPRHGRSLTQTFTFSPTQAGRFSGRITITYRGRVLQTALLNAIVVSRPEAWPDVERDTNWQFDIEAIVRASFENLDHRTPFDASLIFNETPSQQHTVTALSENGAFIGSLDKVAPQLVKLNDLLSQVAHNSKAYAKDLFSKANAQLLYDLAFQGNALYRNFVVDYIDRSPAAQALRRAEYLQVVSANPNAIVPIEFVYEYKLPSAAVVCPNAKVALRSGQCLQECIPKTSPAPHVCPLGFWGLKKVIERHVHDPNLPREALLETDGSGSLSDRDTLAITGASLLAASQEVPPENRSELETSIKAMWQGTVHTVSKWDEWKATVRSQRPVLLLALPHADGTGAQISLEIGGEKILSQLIDESFVRCTSEKAPPIVFLLGCDVASVASTEAYISNIAIFRQAQAAIILGTIATVLGKDAAEIAAKLVTHLTKIAQGSKQRFGEVLRQTKREAVAESLMVALCLIGFGDADWYLT